MPAPATTSFSLPRRCCLTLLVPAEIAIRDAQQAVEKMAADERLTEAVILLGRARDLVADFVDECCGGAKAGK